MLFLNQGSNKTGLWQQEIAQQFYLSEKAEKALAFFSSKRKKWYLFLAFSSKLFFRREFLLIPA